MLPVILGPTAAGKTRLAIALAKRINGAIISADSRQVYRDMDVGTGKDLHAYGDIPYYLIDIVDAGETYHVVRYQEDFRSALQAIVNLGRQPILCGGTGLYIQAVLQPPGYSMIPINPDLRQSLQELPSEVLKTRLEKLPRPPLFNPDASTKKRLIRAIEIAEWCQYHKPPPSIEPPAEFRIFGIAPPLEERRKNITERLRQRLKGGLIEEVEHLLARGIPPERLTYYGLEYKYVTQFLLGELDYETFFNRLNTEIHRFAKRQMTYFRKMEKDGLSIHWLKWDTAENMIEEILRSLKNGKRGE